MTDIIPNGTGAQVRALINAEFTHVLSEISTGGSVLDQNTGTPFKFWQGTQAEYNALAIKDTGTIYFVH